MTETLPDSSTIAKEPATHEAASAAVDARRVYAVSGDQANAERVIVGLKTESGLRNVNQYELALIYVGLGQNEHAFESLERAYREHSDQLIYLRGRPAS